MLAPILRGGSPLGGRLCDGVGLSAQLEGGVSHAAERHLGGGDEAVGLLVDHLNGCEIGVRIQLRAGVGVGAEGKQLGLVFGLGLCGRVWCWS